MEAAKEDNKRFSKAVEPMRKKAKDDSDNYEKPIAKRKSDKELIKKLRKGYEI